MALIPLNTFKTKTSLLGESTATNVYVAPVGTTAIILMAQVSNVSTSSETVSLVHYRNRPILQDAQGNGAQSVGGTYLVQKFSNSTGRCGYTFVW